MKKTSIIIGALLVILAGLSAYFIYLVLNVPNQTVTTAPGNQTTQSGFEPLNTGEIPNQATPTNTKEEGSSSSSTPSTGFVLPKMRQLTSTPVGGFSLTTNILKSGQIGSTTVRWADRGRGNIYEAYGDRVDINILSNTLVPRIYQSWWNKNQNTFLAQYMDVADGRVMTVFTNLLPSKNTDTSSTTEERASRALFELRGVKVTDDIIAAAVSPNKDRLLMVTKTENRSIGYISNFDGSKQTEVFSLPLTQIVVDWPTDNIVTVQTKANGQFAGYFYMIDVKTKEIRQILGGIPGLFAKANRDGTKVIYSRTGSANELLQTYLLNTKTGENSPVVFKTLVDKCYWSKKNVNDVYCAVPNEIADAAYPDDWYLGNLSTIDSLWVLNTNTKNALRREDLLRTGNTRIDVTNLTLDEADTFAIFQNKRDLSLWLLDLVSN